MARILAVSNLGGVPDSITILDLRFGSDRLTLTAGPRPIVVPGEERTFDALVDVRAWPFTGRVEQMLLDVDLEFLAMNLARMRAPGAITFGGERMSELTLSVEPEKSDGTTFSVEAMVTATSDEWPRLTVLLAGQPPFWTGAAERLRQLPSTAA